MKRLLIFNALLLTVFLNTVAQERTIGDITYEVISETATARVKDGKKAKGRIIIPEIVEMKGNSYKVVEIGSNAFQKSAITAVIMPNSLKNIRWNAFSDCTSLEEAAIPAGVKNIGWNAFYNCKALKEIVIPDGMTSIEDGVFSSCGLESIVLPSSITSIGKFAFASNESLRKIDIPNSVTTIKETAFRSCVSLNQITIPNSVNQIGGGIFKGCTGLTLVILPDNKPKKIKSEQEKMFEGCVNIRNVRTNTKPYAGYIDYELVSCPFVLEKLPRLWRSFSYYAYDKVKEQIGLWQKKGEFETTEQWRKRVTEENRKQKLAQVIEELRQKYIAEKSPDSVQGKLGSYDADHATFNVTVNGTSSLYVQVPIEEAPAFKANWAQVKILPQYGIVNDQLSILSCIFNLGNKNYQTTRNSSNDANNNLIADLPPLEINLNTGTVASTPVSHQKPALSTAAPVSIDNGIDLNIPVTDKINAKVFTVIIGNEDYQRVSKVNYALNDAKVFAAYCQKTLGIPENNIRIYQNATYGTMLSALTDIKNISEAYQGDISVIFYYAGHGIPNESDKGAYLLPVDADGSQTEACLSTERLYRELGNLHARSTLVFMDACFSGAERGNGMLTAARGIAIRVKNDHPQGNTVVFSAANGEETAFPYKEKGHGLFTYFLLKKIRETHGNVSLGELSDYIISNVMQQSVVINRKKQTPTVVPSIALDGTWKNKTLIGQ